MSDDAAQPMRWRSVPVGPVYMAFWDAAAPMDPPGVDPEGWDEWCDALRDRVRALPPHLQWLPIDWQGALD